MAKFEGKVETPATPQDPNNYIVKASEEATTVQEIDDLIGHATQHGYSSTGQTMQHLKMLREQKALKESARKKVITEGGKK